MPAVLTDFGLEAMNRAAEEQGSRVRFHSGAARRVNFAHWWHLRDQADDAQILEDAIAQGLVTVGGGLLSLTERGKRLRRGDTTVLAEGRKTDAGKGFEEWWSAICRLGDPLRRPRLTEEAFAAGYQRGRVDAARETEARG